MSIDLSKEKFRKILINLGIKAKDKINVSSNILNIISSKKNELKPLEIIEIIKEIVTRQGTILFPTFNWNFCKGGTFDYRKTKSLSGSLRLLKCYIPWLNYINRTMNYRFFTNKISH